MRGVARRVGTGDGPLAGNVELSVRRKAVRHSIDGAIDLVAADKTARIAISGGSVLPEGEQRTTYDKIANEPGVSELAMKPGPNIEVTLKPAWIKDGASIDVVCHEVDGALRAVVAGSTSAVDDWEARRKREQAPAVSAPTYSAVPWNAIVLFGLVVITIVLAEASVLMGESRFTLIAPSIAIATAGAVVGLLWDQIKLPKFDEREKKRTGLFATAALIIGVGVNLPPEGPLGTAIEGGIVLAVGLFGLVWEHRRVALVKRLVQAPSAPKEGAFGVFVGKVKDRTPDQFFSQLIAVGAIHTFKKQLAQKKAELTTERRGFDTRFQLQMDSKEIDVDPQDATWSSELRNKRETWSVFLPVDADAVVAGTPQMIDGRLCLKSTGPDTLVFYGVPGGTNPQAVLRRKLMLHKATYGAMFMVVALAAALTIHGMR